ncbi:hypothetical protein BTO20_03535 [Mycobacterium dioxanotrophicus]|uniref:Protein-glutamine gamma-glutamyltransferase-like C-terminal domain-containing protein n=1 Tax=Mycobacterium dioxanotrophicus TaxID=482462 RepID=A0A1Y0BXZ8_9MYCO|nr:DUF4129 domain-containing protein [Mycobacterium dioxanotrophicus]ART67783.1 hypothetical protein BTO20_03535 [Mycobacterium dioxanotrophicus]
MSAIDIDRDAAHDAAQNELSKPIYPRSSPTQQFLDWITELFYRLAMQGSKIPGGWFTIAVLAILVVLAVVVAVRTARRTMRTNRGRQYALFGSQELSAAEHRRTAEQYAAQGNWAAAIRHRLRAVAKHLEETGVLDPVPGRTATELARDASVTLGDLSSELFSAASIFNEVSYGEQPGTEAGYRMIAVLDGRLHDHGRTPVGAATATAGSDGWAPVR